MGLLVPLTPSSGAPPKTPTGEIGRQELAPAGPVRVIHQIETRQWRVGVDERPLFFRPEVPKGPGQVMTGVNEELPHTRALAQPLRLEAHSRERV